MNDVVHSLARQLALFYGSFCRALFKRWCRSLQSKHFKMIFSVCIKLGGTVGL